MGCKSCLSRNFQLTYKTQLISFFDRSEISTPDMNCSAHICTTGSRMKIWKMIIVSLKISFADCSKVFFNRFVNNGLLQILWTYVNFCNRTGHITQMFSYTKQKIHALQPIYLSVLIKKLKFLSYIFFF